MCIKFRDQLFGLVKEITQKLGIPVNPKELFDTDETELPMNNCPKKKSVLEGEENSEKVTNV